MKPFLKNYGIYKPNKNGNGGGMQIQLQENKNQVGDFFLFFQFAKQDISQPESKKMLWSDKASNVCMKMNFADIEKILLAIKTNSPLEIIHKTDKHTTYLNWNINQKKPGFYLTVKKDAVQVALPISPEESVGIELVLINAFNKMLGW